MKRIIVFIALVTSTFFYAQTSSSKLKWETDFETAKKIAKKEAKPILMLFTGSDWCPPCKTLKKDFFNSSEFSAKANSFVLLLVDFPRNKENISEAQQKANKALNSAYGVRSLPTIIATDYNGRVIDKIKSYNSARDTRYHFEFINKLIK